MWLCLFQYLRFDVFGADIAYYLAENVESLLLGLLSAKFCILLSLLALSVLLGRSPPVFHVLRISILLVALVELFLFVFLALADRLSFLHSGRIGVERVEAYEVAFLDRRSRFWFRTKRLLLETGCLSCGCALTRPEEITSLRDDLKCVLW